VYEARGRLEYAEPVIPDPTLDRKFEVITEELRRLPAAKSLLDAGCGDGRYLAALPTLGPLPRRVVGVDIAESILQTARAAAARAGVRPELVRANVERLPFADAEFDLVLCSQVIEHLLDPEAGLRELARVVAPGGFLVLTTDNRRNLITKTLNAPRWLVLTLVGKRRARVQLQFPHRDYTKRDLTRGIRASGLDIARTRTFRFYIAGAGPRLTRLCSSIDRRLPDVGVGDILLVVARRPQRD
jgi:ubiquinone/menaquinone biosynthesis C-methylase UbiE